MRRTARGRALRESAASSRGVTPRVFSASGCAPDFRSALQAPTWSGKRREEGRGAERGRGKEGKGEGARERRDGNEGEGERGRE